jgi:cytochrome c-type biogenesis protein CcmH
MSIRRGLAIAAVAASSILAPVAARAAPPAPANGAITGVSTPPTGAERALQGRLMGPCCWTQTLDVHESEISTQLRSEIRTRLGRGEAAEAIEDDFAARFGERIRAVPKGKDPLKRVPVVVGFAMLASAVGLALVLRRWTRRPEGDERLPSAPRDDRPDEYDARLDDELRDLDA